MVVFEHLTAVLPGTMSGIIERCHRRAIGPNDDGNETYQRESRTGAADRGSLRGSDPPPNREWALHRQDPSKPKPPGKRWYEYPKRRPPQAIARAWSEAIPGVTDRTGRATFQHIPETRQPTVETALVPQVAPDAMVLFDGAPRYEAIARARGISCEVLVAGHRSQRLPKAYRLNGVNSRHAHWRSATVAAKLRETAPGERFRLPNDLRKRWRRPATEYLDGDTRWMVARRGADPLAMFRALIV